MDQRSRAALKFAFLAHGRQQYVLHSGNGDQGPDLAIVDGDGPEGQALWDRFRADYPHLPALYTSLHDADLPDAETVRKPLRIETLFPAMERALAPDEEVPEQKKPAFPDGARLARQIAKAEEAAPAKTHETRLAANDELLPVAEVTRLSASVSHFDPTRGLLGMVRSLRAKAISAWVDTVDRAGILAVLPAENLVYQAVSEADLSRYCREDTQCSFRYMGQEEQDRVPTADLEALDSLLWRVAAKTSRGRLPQGIKVGGKRLKLKRWPNFTRLDPIPDAVRIAAFLARTPADLALVMRMIRVEPANLYTFVSAAASLGLLVEVEETEEQRAPARPTAPPVSRERRGMLSRLLRRLVG
jgi:hypothetical protein